MGRRCALQQIIQFRRGEISCPKQSINPDSETNCTEFITLQRVIDASLKAQRRKRYIVVDTLGLILAAWFSRGYPGSRWSQTGSGELADRFPVYRGSGPTVLMRKVGGLGERPWAMGSGDREEKGRCGGLRSFAP